MARSLGLAAYRALSGRREDASFTPSTPRPEGELIWLHAAEPGSLSAIIDLAGRLCAARVGLMALITVPAGSTPPQEHASEQLILEVLPSDHPVSTQQFLDYWTPDTCLWCWGDLLPNILIQAAEREIPLLLIDAGNGGFDMPRDRWLPDVTRQVLSKFDTILARSEETRLRIVKIGISDSAVQLSSPLLVGGRALPCSETELSEMAQALGGRPVWFANRVLIEELPDVLAAHRTAMRLSHRLLLMINPAQPEMLDEFCAQVLEQRFTLTRWPDGGFPDASAQVMVAQETGDAGLFYRVAPLSFLGSSLVSGPVACDPFEAASLGSAILYGPRVGQYLAAYTRLADMGAARIVKDGETLGNAVSRLIAPDQAAAMAHAGWEVISRGAENMDRIVELAQDALDRRGKTT